MDLVAVDPDRRIIGVIQADEIGREDVGILKIDPFEGETLRVGKMQGDGSFGRPAPQFDPIVIPLEIGNRYREIGMAFRLDRLLERSRYGEAPEIDGARLRMGRQPVASCAVGRIEDHWLRAQAIHRVLDLQAFQLRNQGIERDTGRLAGQFLGPALPRLLLGATPHQDQESKRQK